MRPKTPKTYISKPTSKTTQNTQKHSETQKTQKPKTQKNPKHPKTEKSPQTREQFIKSEQTQNHLLHDATTPNLAAMRILRATYGPPSAEREAPWKLRFVTLKLQALVDSQLVVSHPYGNGGSILIKNRLNGLFGDPSPGQRKVLSVHYSLPSGLVRHGRWAEGSLVVLQKGRLEDGAKKGKSHRDLRVRANAFVNPDLLREIVSFLPVVPDRFTALLVSKSWHESVLGIGLTDSFCIGERGMPGACYLDLAPRVVRHILYHSKTRLVELDLSNYTQMDDKTLTPVLEASTKLKKLLLNYCVNLTNLSLSRIATCNKELVELELKGIVHMDDTVVSAIANSCGRLKSVNLSDCSTLTDESISHVTSKLKHLVVLYLKHCHRVTDRSISYIGAEHPCKIEELGLWSLHQLTDAAFCGINGADMKCLTSLVLTACLNVTYEGIKKICDSCVNLLQLNLSFCHRVTDQSIVYVATHLSRLEHLNLQYLVSITDKSLAIIASNLKYLRSLNLSRCLKITANAVVDMCARLQQLNELFLRCTSIDDATIKRMIGAVKGRNGVIDLLDLRHNLGISAEVDRLLEEAFEHEYKCVDQFYFNASSLLN